MKLFSKILSKKPEPEPQAGKIDLEMDVEPLRRKSEVLADDTGAPNASKLGAKADDPLFANPGKPIHARDEEPEEVEGAGWGAGSAWDDGDWDDDEDWGDDELDEVQPVKAASGENAHLVEDIRGAVGAAAHVEADHDRVPSKPRSKPRSIRPNWAQDEDFGRKAAARSQLGGDGEAEDRILRETNTMMTDRETSRRRSAMAHLKAAAAATKADRVLQHVASRDAAGDPEEQSPYRDDLAKVVRPRSTSRPISRPVSRPRTEPAPWDQGASDDDAAMFAAASEDGMMTSDTTPMMSEEEAARAERLARAPADLSAEDFADDGFYGSDDDAKEATFGDSDFARMDTAEADDEFEDEGADEAQSTGGDWASRWDDTDDDAENAFSAGFDDEEEDEPLAADASNEDGPVPSRVVSEVVAFANTPEDSGSQVDDAFVRRQIAEMAASQPAPEPESRSEDAADAIVNVGAAVSGRAGRSAGRVKTRLLGFQAPDDAPQDVFEAAKTASADNKTQFPVGWIIVIDGPGRGTCYTMFNGVSQIGRGEDQAVRLDFGDTSISRNNHAAVAFDDEQGKFFLGHGGKSNLVRLNGKPVLSTEELSNGDEVRIGETTLKFVALCGEDFTWAEDATEGNDA
jgi:hypothetical protein